MRVVRYAAVVATAATLAVASGTYQYSTTDRLQYPYKSLQIPTDATTKFSLYPVRDPTDHQHCPDKSKISCRLNTHA